MKKTDTIFSSAGVVAGALSIASGFYLARSVSHLSEQITEIAYEDSVADYFSSFFSSGSSGIDTTEILLIKLCEICAKGLGILLIVLGLFAALAFGMKLLDSISGGEELPPPMPPETMGMCHPEGYYDCCPPQEEYFAAPAAETAQEMTPAQENEPVISQTYINS